MLRGARRTYPSMNVFIFGLGRVIVAYGQCRGSEWQSKLRLQRMSSWSSIPRAASSNPIRKLGRYGPLKMCYFCVMFSFRSELLWKSPNEVLFAWKLFVLLGSLQKPLCRAQKRLTLTDGLCNFLWPDQKGGLQAGNTGLDSILAEFFSWFCRDRFLFEQAGLFPSKQAGLEEDFASYTVQKKSFFRFLVEIFIFSWSWVRAVSWCCEVPSQIAKNQLFTFLMKKCFFLPITKKAGRRAQYLYENKTKKKKREGKTATTSVPRHRATARTNFRHLEIVGIGLFYSVRFASLRTIVRTRT